MVKQDLLPGDGFVSLRHYSPLARCSYILVIIEGTATIPIALAAAFVLPDYPETTKWSAVRNHLTSYYPH